MGYSRLLTFIKKDLIKGKILRSLRARRRNDKTWGGMETGGECRNVSVKKKKKEKEKKPTESTDK